MNSIPHNPPGVPCASQLNGGGADAKDLAANPLRVGLSTTVTVDTTRSDGPVLASDTEGQFAGDTQVYTRDIEKANAEAEAIVRHNLGIEP